MSFSKTAIIGLGKTGLSCAYFLAARHIPFLVIDSRENPPELKIFQSEFPHVDIYLSSFFPDILQSVDRIILSPGVSPQEPAIAAQIQRRVPVIGDIELFAQSVTSPVVAITGTNGKSTVTTLVGLMATAAGFNVGVGGNLGMPALNLITEPEPDLYVLELSSFQLATTYSLKPKAAVMLNFSPDHLDRYHEVEQYLQDKQKIYAGCEVAVVNGHQPEIWVTLLESQRQKNIKKIVDFMQIELPLPLSELKIKGLHNIDNAKAAVALGRAMGFSEKAMASVLKTFTGLPHRSQTVATVNGITWVNDSKGTNVGASVAAITGLGETLSGKKLILIAGGQSKGQTFEKLNEAVKKYVRQVILIGEAADQIAAILSETSVLRALSLEQAVSLAHSVAEKGDVVLLSPACSSFDMFNNFEHRGAMFETIVKQKIQEKIGNA